jgi:hypothetical protein
MGLTQDKLIYTLPAELWQWFFHGQRNGHILNGAWAECRATQGCDPSAGPGAGMVGGIESPTKRFEPFRPKSDKSREREGRALALK